MTASLNEAVILLLGLIIKLGLGIIKLGFGRLVDALVA